MSDTHPVMLRYGNTEDFSFPLILIVGREPNRKTGESTDQLGGLPFNEKSKSNDAEQFNNNRCAFWNISFATLATKNDSTTKEIKEDFTCRNACPIIITDASPIAIPNKNSKKQMERNGIGETKFKEQLEKIFKHKELLSRVKLVIFSGLDHGVYKFFKDEFVNFRDKNGFDFVINDKVPFFYPTNF